MLPRTLPALTLAALTATLALSVSAPRARAAGVRFGVGVGVRAGEAGASLTGAVKLGLELDHGLFLTGQLESFLLERDWTGEARPAGWRLGLMYELPLPLPLGLDLGASVGPSVAPLDSGVRADSVLGALAEVGLSTKLGPARLRLYANTPVWSADDTLMRQLHGGEVGLRLGLGL